MVVEAGSFEGARAYAARLTQELRASPSKLKRIAYRIDPERFERHQLLYLSTAELVKIRDKIFDHQEFMEGFAGDPSLARLLEGVNTQMAAAFVASLFDLGLQEEDLPVDTHFLQGLLDQMESRLERPGPYRSPWGTLFSLREDASADAGYFLSEDKRLLFILVEPPEGQHSSFVGDRDRSGACLLDLEENPLQKCPPLPEHLTLRLTAPARDLAARVLKGALQQEPKRVLLLSAQHKGDHLQPPPTTTSRRNHVPSGLRILASVGLKAL